MQMIRQHHHRIDPERPFDHHRAKRAAQDFDGRCMIEQPLSIMRQEREKEGSSGMVGATVLHCALLVA